MAQSGTRNRPSPVRAMVLLSATGVLLMLFVGVPVLGKVLDFPVRLEFYVALIAFIAGVGVCFVVGSRRPPGTPLTWGEALIAATFVFGVMLVGYGVVPNEWLKWADNQLLWRPDRIWFAVSAKWWFFHTGTNAATEAAAGRGRIIVSFQSLRDIIAAGIYIVLLGAHAALWVAFQKRGRRPVSVAEVERTSTFGRPVVKRA